MRWMDSVIADLATMEIRGWRIKVADRDDWRTVVNEAKTHQGLYSQLKKKKIWCYIPEDRNFHSHSCEKFNI
jgi:hypothetical protein